MSGKPWYNNGKIEIQVSTINGEEVPYGFTHGRLPKTKEEKDKIVEKWNKTMLNKSEEDLAEINRKRSESLVKTHSAMGIDRKAEIVEKRKTTMRSKSEEDLNLIYSKISQSTMGKNKGKIPWNKGLTSDTDCRVADIAAKVSVTNKKKSEDIKESNPLFYTEWRAHVSDAMKANGTYGKSKVEDKYYEELCEKYGSNDVIRQYTDDRYPFDCDFYIKSIDLFIELNIHWTHGKHPYDKTNPMDVEVVNQWIELSKTSEYYKNAVYVWTELDVKKKEIAKANNLNYMTVY